MKRLTGLFWGIALGALLMYAAFKYHVVRATDGWHLVPKSSAQLTAIYVDIREYTLQDWNEHRELAIDITTADKAYLLQAAATNSLNDAIEGVFKPK